MTKLCNTCEYLRYCARSGIEDVGCDRYKRDTTTNEQWIKQANTEQLAEFLADICDSDEYGCKYDENENKSNWVEWLKQPHTP